MKEILEGITFWVFLGGSLWLIRPKSAMHRIPASGMGRKHFLLLAGVVCVLIVVSALGMTLSPIWNGTIMEHKGQYELMTESVLQGRLDLDIRLDPRLPEMENPYDPAARLALQIDCPLDHAYYQGHYYMYFGIVPVFLAFLPFRVIFGQALLSVHATQFFTAVFMAGMAVYFCWLAKRFFPRLTLGALLLLLILFSLLSALYPIKFPSLYQTPVACGMMLEIWSLFCFSRAFLEDRTDRSVRSWTWAGSFLGALTFGCRPPLALANLAILPLAIFWLRKKKITARRVCALGTAFLPYVLVAIGLMWYNFARFGSPFEFGQAYQLTTANQSQFGHVRGLNDFVRALMLTWNALFAMPPLNDAFPFMPLGYGAFVCCPLLALSYLSVMGGSVRAALREKHLCGFLVMTAVSAVIISFFQVIWSPEVLERYKSDVLYLLSTGAFLCLGAWISCHPRPERASHRICCAALACVLIVILLFIIPDDLSYTAYYTGSPERIWERITFHLN